MHTCINFDCDICLDSRETNVSLPQSTIANGTLFAHIFVGPDNLQPHIPKNYGRFKIITVPLTKYLPPSTTEFNLVTGEYEVFIALLLNFHNS